MQHLVIGYGEIGKALTQVLKCDFRDKTDDTSKEHYDVIHICYPHFNGFNKSVKSYIKRYTPDYVVVHSTVPVGTCGKLGVLHSPVTGVHPNLAKSIKTFTKFVGGDNSEVIADEFKKYKIPSVPVASASDTEAGKLYNLLAYGINILIEKEIWDFCHKNNLNYDIVYSQFVKMYNQGYEKMKMPHVKIYELKHFEGGIGGHCVMENSPLLNTELSRFLDDYNVKFVK